MSARLPQPSTMVATTAMPATYAISLHPDASGRRARWLGLWLLAASVALVQRAEAAGLLTAREEYLAQRNGFRIQIREFTKPAGDARP